MFLLIKNIFVVFVLLFATISFSRADYYNSGTGMWTNPYNGSTWNNPMSSLLSTMIQNQVIQKAVENSSSTPDTTVLPPVNIRTTFKPVADQLMIPVMMELYQVTSENPAELENWFHQMLIEYKNYVKGLNHSNDVAFSITYLIGACRSIIEESEFSETQFNPLYKEISNALISSNSLANTSDREKQQLFEFFAMQSMFLEAIYERAVENNNETDKLNVQALALASLVDFIGVTSNN